VFPVTIAGVTEMVRVPRLQAPDFKAAYRSARVSGSQRLQYNLARYETFNIRILIPSSHADYAFGRQEPPEDFLQSAQPTAGHGSPSTAGTRALLVGTWRSENNITLTLEEDGSQSISYEDGTIARGTWALEGDILVTLLSEFAKPRPQPLEIRRQILELSENSLKTKHTYSGKVGTWNRVR
jgi:hypothetical protein